VTLSRSMSFDEMFDELFRAMDAEWFWR
jgi:hypothetical protein